MGNLVRHGMSNRVYKVPGREEGQGGQVSGAGKETEEKESLDAHGVALVEG